jgi:hypothetical protein
LPRSGFIRAIDAVRDQAPLLIVAALFIGYHIASIVLTQPAVDLSLRVTESRYLVAGIDPYLIMTGDIEPLAGLGWTSAYSFVSYVLILPLTVMESHVARELTFVAFETMLLIVSLRLVGGLVGGISRRMLIALTVGLLGSVFFLQHVWTLNYAIVGASAAVMSLTAGRYGRRWQGVLGLVLIGVKPSFAIPVALVLLARREWRILLPASAILGGLLFVVALRLDRNPVSVLLSAASTADYWSTGYENGVLFPVWGLVAPVAVPLGVVLTAIVVFVLRARLSDPVIGLVVPLALGMGMFYNHVHAWTAAFPIVLVASAWSSESRDAMRALALLLAFMLLARLVGAVPVEHRDLYVAVHNLIRFGGLFVGVALVMRAATATVRTPGAFADELRKAGPT